jgi:NAD(P)-dependent dehydrogenase (short-subunit alcohol dehydrogenase family)
MSERADAKAPAALVTGAAVRLGRELALALAREGHDIALHFGRSAEAAAATRAEVEALGVSCESFPQDLGAVEALDGLVARAHRAFPHLGLLVNSASAYGEGTITETTPALFDEQLAVNLRAPFFLIQAFARRCGRGHVVNVLDNKIAFNQYQYAAYLLAKKGLSELTQIAAMELAPRIRVNGIAPGVVLPASSRSAEYLAWRREGIPLRVTGDVAGVCEALLFLQRSGFVTGQVVFVDGGESVAHIGRSFGGYDDTSS